MPARVSAVLRPARRRGLARRGYAGATVSEPGARTDGARDRTRAPGTCPSDPPGRVPCRADRKGGRMATALLVSALDENRILRALPEQDRRDLASQFEPYVLEHEILVKPGGTIAMAYF